MARGEARGSEGEGARPHMNTEGEEEERRERRLVV